MPLTRPIFDVWLDLPDELPEGTEAPEATARVTILSGDQLRAELELSRLKLGAAQLVPMNLTALWLWSALVRLELVNVKAADFLAHPPEWQPVKLPGGQLATATVDPTTAVSGVTGSA